MSGIYGILGIDDTDRSYVDSFGQRAIFDAANQYLMMVDQEIQEVVSAFVEEETEDHKERYYLPGGGRLQRRGGLVESAASKASGSWDVAYPLEEFGTQVAGDRVSLAYMRMDQLNRHLEDVRIKAINTVRWEILHALLDDGGGAARTFVDPIRGSLSIQPLANGDSVTYPPVLGSESEATEDHYAESNYATANVSDTNNPLVTLRDELVEHFGQNVGGENIVVFCNNAETAQLESLTDFDPVEDTNVRSGSNRDIPVNLPMVPGTIKGRSNGVWVSEWRWMPATYLLALHLDAPAPLKMRVDLADTGLPRGLNLIAESDMYPLRQSHYEWRFGLGVGNRLNGAVLELNTGGSYTIPTAYD
jgi:hypothetical protein